MSELHSDLVQAIKYWTEDPDRCDMEGREDEVAWSLVPVLVDFLRDKAAGVEAELVPAAADLGRATAGGTGWTAAQNQVVALAFLRDRLETWIAELGGGESR